MKSKYLKLFHFFIIVFFVSSFTKTDKQYSTQKKLIPFEITKDKEILVVTDQETSENPQWHDREAMKNNRKTAKQNNVIEAKVKEDNIRGDGKKIKINEMIIKGKITNNSDHNGQKKLSISWDEVSDGENSTQIDNPLVSEVIIDAAKLEKGDSFAAQGDSAELIRAWKKLKGDDFALTENQDETMKINENEEGKEKEKKKKDVAEDSNAFVSSGSGVGGRSGSSSTTSPDSKNENFDPVPNAEVKKDDIIESTDNGCDFRIDKAQMMAIKQERILKNGEEMSPCNDTIDRYPLTKVYKDCPIFEDVENLKAFKRYNLGYTHPSTEKRALVDGGECFVDEDEFAIIKKDYEACEPKDYFDKGYSYAQYQHSYIMDGKKEVIGEGCIEDSNKSYKHNTTFEGCTDNSSIHSVIIYSRKYIDVDLPEKEQTAEQKTRRKYITECIPDEKQITRVDSEICADDSKKFTHEMDLGRSYYNKTWFYMKNNKRYDIAVCQKSNDYLVHELDTNQCQSDIINDDEKKISILKARTFIKENKSSEPIWLSECEVTNSAIPYIPLNLIWAKNGNTLMQNIYILGYNSGVVYTQEVFDAYRCNKNINVSHYQSRCFGAAQWWRSSNNEEIDANLSNALPNWEIYMSSCKPTRRRNKESTYEFRCRNPKCPLTELVKHQKYRRHDGSEYLDTSSTIDGITYICGDGSHLIGKTVN